MKLNFTKTTAYLSLFASLLFLYTSCSDTQTPNADPTGTYVLKSATLEDGDTGTDGTQNLFIKNGLTDPTTGAKSDADLPPGEVQFTTLFVNGLLAQGAPCTDPINAATYQIDFKTGGVLAFNCPAESINKDSGTWTAVSPTSVTLSVNASFSPVPIPIVINDVQISSTAFSGTIVSFPMAEDLAIPIDATNLQNISVSVELTKVQ